MGRPNNNGYTEKLASSRRPFWGYDYEKNKHQTGGSVVSKKTIGMGRTERSSKARWSNRPSRQEIIDQRDNFTPQEEELLIKLHATIGARWTIIAQQLPGRGEGEVKNVWNTKLKKKLTAMGIDPVTHKPFSQILSDYLGNVAPAAGQAAYNYYSPASATQLQPPHFNTTLKTTILMSNYTEPQPPPTPEDADCFRPMANGRNYTDLLSELQAIKSIANYTAPGPTPSPLSSSSLSSSSSLITSSPALLLPTSSCGNNNNQEIKMNNDSSTSAAAAAAGFSWSDFLLEDAFLPGGGEEGPQEEQDDCCRNSSLNDVVPRLEAASSSSSSSSSFVEAMLSREDDNMLLLDFPAGLSEEPFYY